MTVLPVIVRELRAQARQPFTYALRILSAAALLSMGIFFGVSSGLSLDQGGSLFGHLNLTLFAAIWILVPFMTADCISRERREGTLGLLFLTPLNATDIVLAKGLVHGLRAMTLWLAVLPILTIPFLMGGVGWKEATVSCLMNFSSLCLAVAAGLYGSSMSKVFLRALVAAVCLALFLLVAFAYTNGFAVLAALVSGVPGSVTWDDIQGSERLEFLFVLVTNEGGKWQDILNSLPPGAHVRWIAASAGVAALSMLTLRMTIPLAARNVRRTWQDLPASPQEIWLEKKFCTPVVGVSFFKKWMRRKLERNPIGWLEQRTWSGRLVTWSWFAVLISVYSWILTEQTFFRSGFNGMQHALASLLVGSIAVSASGSFRRERETGLLELLLVTPLTVAQIITGRVRGLWGQFLPAMAMLLGVWLYLGPEFDRNYGWPREGNGELFLVWYYACTFLTLPVIGLYFSLRCAGFVSAFLWTLAVGILLPFVGLWAISGANDLLVHLFLSGELKRMWFTRLVFLSSGLDWPYASIFQLLFAGFVGWRLYLRLRNRTFALGKMIT